MSKIISIIPARGGSKRVPKKNIKLFCGKPLIAWTIEQSLKAKNIGETFVSTDDKEIKRISEDFGATVLDRPDSIAGDVTSTEAVLEYHLKDLEYDICVLLQCTSPLRKKTDIDNCVNYIKTGCFDSVLSATYFFGFLWKESRIDNQFFEPVNYHYLSRPRSQDVRQWLENGSIYVFSNEVFGSFKNRLGGRIGIYQMGSWQRFEIDSVDDFVKCEEIMKEKLL